MGKYDLAFDVIDGNKQFGQLTEFLLAHPGSYEPRRYTEWLEETCLPAVASGERRALGWWQHGTMIGDAVLKVHQPNVAELKNFRVASPGWLSGRGLGGFLLKQAAAEAVELLAEHKSITSDSTSVILQLDTSAESPAHAFFAHHGFHEVGRAALYAPDQQDVLMALTIPLN